jgi:hypothetical protein
LVSVEEELDETQAEVLEPSTVALLQHLEWLVQVVEVAELVLAPELLTLVELGGLVEALPNLLPAV